MEFFHVLSTSQHQHISTLRHPPFAQPQTRLCPNQRLWKGPGGRLLKVTYLHPICYTMVSWMRCSIGHWQPLLRENEQDSPTDSSSSLPVDGSHPAVFEILPEHISATAHLPGASSRGESLMDKAWKLSWLKLQTTHVLSLNWRIYAAMLTYQSHYPPSPWAVLAPVATTPSQPWHRAIADDLDLGNLTKTDTTTAVIDLRELWGRSRSAVSFPWRCQVSGDSQ